MSTDATWPGRWFASGRSPPFEAVASVSILRQRAWLMAGSAAVNFVLLRLAGFPAGRFVVLLAIYALPMAVALYHAAQVQTQQHVRAGLWRSLLVSEVFGPAVVTITGGLSITTIVCLLAIAPGAVTGPSISRPYWEIMIAFGALQVSGCTAGPLPRLPPATVPGPTRLGPLPPISPVQAPASVSTNDSYPIQKAVANAVCGA